MSIRDAQIMAKASGLVGGFHRVDWEIVREWIEGNVSAPDWARVWNEAALIWVTKLRDDLGGAYFVAESPQTILLSAQSRETAQRLLNYAGRAAATIREQLGLAAWGGATTRDVILVFSEDDDYYEYIAFHTPDGEHAASGGVCIHSGYTHMAVPWRNELDAVNAIVHELSHDCLAHLRLPLWLNEGVALTLQRALAPAAPALGQNEQDAFFAASIGWRPPIMWDELAERHFAFWDDDNIQEFWAGTSFHKPGDSNELSYSLAEVLLKTITDQAKRPAFLEFLQGAEQGDAGQSAAIKILQVQLGEIAGKFLGEGDWQPKRSRMIELWEQAGWIDGDTRANAD